MLIWKQDYTGCMLNHFKTDLVNCLLFYDNEHLLVGSDSFNFEIKILNFSTSKITRKLKGHKSWTTCFTKLNSYFVASGSADHTIIIWSMHKFKSVTQLVGHSDWIRCLAYSGSHKMLLSGSDDLTIRF